MVTYDLKEISSSFKDVETGSVATHFDTVNTLLQHDSLHLKLHEDINICTSSLNNKDNCLGETCNNKLYVKMKSCLQIV